MTNQKSLFDVYSKDECNVVRGAERNTRISIL